ncbi:hypothetical protein H0H81_008292 [Sphagnurus paluster]|uniref:Uncharacterized protein n=1 Tax=Sphagnurus paluster TaxID=117069 RepID=A0A9P7GLK0_9AGAR|nr:hypothetical protein H0H81_008292 [Sphagnurus paluster]
MLLSALFALSYLVTLGMYVPLSSLEARLGLFVVALLAPELVALWSLQQWFASRALAHEHRDFGWTQTHGFFAIMGGFVECDNGQVKPIGTDFLGEYLEEKVVSITENDIKGMSKGNFLSKSVVVIQLTWFVIQLIG